MTMPPKNVEPSALWLALSSTERPYRKVDFPRTRPDGTPMPEVAIRILTQEEQMICSAAAEQLTRKHLKEAKRDDLGYERLFSDALCVEILFRSCRDADDPMRTAFPSPAEIRAQLTTEECAMLFSHYLTTQLELGPTVARMTSDEVDAWIERLVEGGSAFPFDRLSSELQTLVLLRMGYLLRSSRTGSTSPTEPDDASSSDGEPHPAESE